jgi:sugar phosphate isomerase/epimerase
VTATATHPDVGHLIGMTVALARLDLESAVNEIAHGGFGAVEVHGSQLGPGLPGVPITERHAEAAGQLIRAIGLVVSTLNVVDDATFDPHGDPEARERTTSGLATHLRWAAAMGAPRVLIFEGRAAAENVPAAIAKLVETIEQARERCGLADPPAVSVELHPFTFALAHGAVAELAHALLAVEAGLCLDFCHFAVALGASFSATLTDEIVRAINHVHLSDSDCVSSELHFPPGLGMLDLEAIVDRLARRELAIGWDLFGWPWPRKAVQEHRDAYAALVARQRPAPTEVRS